MRRVDLAPLRGEPKGGSKRGTLRHPLNLDGRHVLSLRKDVMSFYDTWPAGGADSKPELLTFSEGVVGKGLEDLLRKYPDEPAAPKHPQDNPFNHTDDDQLAEEQVKHWGEGRVEVDRLSYKLERLQIFTASLRTLASGFKTYRPLLMWCCTELLVFRDFLLSLVESLGQKVMQTHQQVQDTEAQAARAAKRFEASQAILKEQMKTQEEELNVHRSRRVMEETIIEGHQGELAALQKIIDEKDRNAQILLGRIRKLEKKLTDNSMQTVLAKVAKLQEDLDENVEKNESLRESLKLEAERNEKLKKRVELLESEEGIRDHPVVQSYREDIARCKEALEDMRRGNTTPRPKWTNYPPHLVSYDESTSYTVEKLVTRYLQCTNALEKTQNIFSPLTKLRSTDDQKWMVGLGNDTGIPVFLRSEKKVPNTKMPKRQAEFLIREMLRERAFQRSAGDLATFFQKQLQARYKADWVVISYNFIATLQKHLADADCRTFLFALFADMNEEVIHAQTSQVKEYKNLLKDGSDKNGCISKDLTRDIVANECGVGSEAILAALDRDLHLVEEDSLRYHHLFQNDEDLNESNFVEAVRKKVADDREHLLSDAEDQILSIDPVPPSGITRDLARGVLKAVDPHMPQEKLEDTLDTAYGIPPTNRFALSQLELIVVFRKLLSARHTVRKPATPARIEEPAAPERVHSSQTLKTSPPTGQLSRAASRASFSENPKSG